MVRLLFSLRWSEFNHWACELDVSFGFLLGDTAAAEAQDNLELCWRPTSPAPNSFSLPTNSSFAVLLTLPSSMLEEDCGARVSARLRRSGRGSQPRCARGGRLGRAAWFASSGEKALGQIQLVNFQLDLTRQPVPAACGTHGWCRGDTRGNGNCWRTKKCEEASLKVLTGLLQDAAFIQ